MCQNYDMSSDYFLLSADSKKTVKLCTKSIHYHLCLHFIFKKSRLLIDLILYFRAIASFSSLEKMSTLFFLHEYLYFEFQDNLIFTLCLSKFSNRCLFKEIKLGICSHFGRFTILINNNSNNI